LEGALDYFSREITQSRVQPGDSRSTHEGATGGGSRGETKREREKEEEKEMLGAGGGRARRRRTCHDMWILKIEHPKQP